MQDGDTLLDNRGVIDDDILASAIRNYTTVVPTRGWTQSKSADPKSADVVF